MKIQSDDADAHRHLESGMHNLWSAFAQSVRDNVIGEVAVQILRFGGLIVLARALRPGDFGLFRVLLVVSATIPARAMLARTLSARRSAMTTLPGSARVRARAG